MQSTVKSLRIKVLDNFYENERDYNRFDYKGITIFIMNTIELKENARIYIQLKLPFMSPIFKLDGIDYWKI